MNLNQEDAKELLKNIKIIQEQLEKISAKDVENEK